MRLRGLLLTGLAAVLALTGCSGSTGTSTPSTSASSGSASGPTDRSYDVSGVAKVDSIAALLPASITNKGMLTIGASTDYAPAEFRADDLQTAIGYDVDLGKALGRVLGVETEVVHGEFASLLPGIGSRYDIGISSFTIRPDRVASYNMISYITVGSSFAVKAGNPNGFNPDDVCGQSIGVQTGTAQEDDLGTISDKCLSDGKKAVEILSYPLQGDVTTNVAGGRAVAMYADSTVSDYAVTLTGDQLEVVGGVRDAAPQGIVVAQNDAALTQAIQQAMQHLMDDGTWDNILAAWGIHNAALSTAELNPAS